MDAAAQNMNSVRAPRAMATAPQALAAQSALAVMRDGGNAVEAMLSAAATIAVVYPHMNGIGGDGFWLIVKPGEVPVGIEACGGAAAAATTALYRARGLDAIPSRGPLAANTVAGTVSGWALAQRWSHDHLQGTMPLDRLLADAIGYAREGIPVTGSQARCIATRRAELEGIAGFGAVHLPNGQAPREGARFMQPRMAATLEQLARAGLDDFYRGDLARSIARDLQHAGSPLTLADLEAFRARHCAPLAMAHSTGTIFNLPPPTQGLISLVILGLADRLVRPDFDPVGAPFVHACVEATKLAFEIRDTHVTDPDYMSIEPAALLRPAALDSLARRISMTRAAPWGAATAPADTVWLGTCDRDGVAVSFIQSIYHEYGSGIVLPESGINWQNRGCSFSLDPSSRNALLPGRRPFHTLNPAAARFADGRAMVYGAMGGDGQPQSQAAVFSRIAQFRMSPQAAIDAPRWLLGRTWGQASDTLKLEARFPQATFDELRRLGHEVERMQSYDETMGHAGAIVRSPDGILEGGSDPRSDGAVAGW